MKCIRYLLTAVLLTAALTGCASASSASSVSAASSAAPASFETAQPEPDAAAQGLRTVEQLGLADGVYSVEVTLEGGSGRASVKSPTELRVENGAATAVVTFNSSSYDYMVVEGDMYLEAEYVDDCSTFTVPVSGFDGKLPIQADTVAMSEAHLIDYTLLFDSASLTAADGQ